MDKQSPQYQENLVKTARYNLLVLIIFTVLNLVMILVQSDTYFLFSATIPYYLTCFGYMFDHYTVGTYALTGMVVSLPFVLAYVACWLLCKRDSRWYTVALVLFAVDCLALLGLLIMTGNFGGALFDILIHGWIVVSLVKAISAAKKLQAMESTPELSDPQVDFDEIL